MKKLLILFATFFKIGLFTFGGGYAMLSLIQAETVTKKHWLEGDELLNIIAISESTPGPISINCATYIGYKRAGFFGALFATLGVVLPSFIIIFAISFFIEDFLKIEIINKAFKGIQACVAVLIIRAAFKMAKNIKKDAISFVILFAAMSITIAVNFISFNLSSIYIIIIGGAVGFIYYGLIKKKSEKSEVQSAASDSQNQSIDDASQNINNTQTKALTLNDIVEPSDVEDKEEKQK